MAMLKKPRKDAAKNKPSISRNFETAVLERASEAARRYQIAVRFDEEEGEYFGRCLEIPGAMGDGATPQACFASTREAVIALLAFMIERNERIPAPAASEIRTEQINIRLTASEKLVLEEVSGRRGFRGVSDFVRDAALHEADSFSAAAPLRNPQSGTR